MPEFRMYRIEFRVGRLPFTWVRAGASKARVRELAQRVISEQYGPHAKVKSVEQVRD